MADYNLGTARGVIEIEYNGQGATQASRDMRNVGSSAQDASARYSKSAGTLAKGGAVIAGGLALAVKSAADFEKGLSNIEAVSGASSDQMEQIRNKALQLGKDTQFSASESASAIEELVKAGVSVQDVMAGAADSTVALAAAGGVSMPEAATIASNAMNQFGLAAKEMPKVADAIAGAANASAIDVSDFGMSLSQVGAVANLAGVKFEDTATAIALMGNAGIKGSDAGTSLKSMFQRLQPTTEKQATLMEDLGIITEDGANKFYDAAGNMKSLSDVSGVLQKSLKGMSKQQQQATLNTLFGSDAIRAAAILADNGSKGFDKMADSMGKVSAADVAATKMDNLAGSVEQLKGSLETLMIMIGTPLLNGIRMVVDGFTGFLNLLLGLPEPVLKAVAIFAAMLSAGLLLAAGILKARAAFIAFRAGALLLTGPIVAIVAAIAALVAAFVYFYQTNAKFRAFVNQMGAVLKDALGKAMDWLIPKLQQFGAFLVKVFQASLPYLKSFGQTLVTAFNAALPTIQKVWSFLQTLAGVFMDEVVPALREAAGFIVDGLVSAFHMIAPQIPPLIAGVKDFIASIVGLAQAIMGTPAFKFFVTVIKIIATVIVGTLIPLLVRLGGIFIGVFVKVIGNALRTAMGIIRGVLNVISGIIKVFTGILTGNWSKAWEGVKQILRGVVGVLGSILRGFLGTAGAIIRGIGSAIVAGVKAIPGLLRGLGGLFLAAGHFIIDQFVQGIKNAAGLISGIAGNIWDFVRGLLNGAIGSINSALEFTINPPGPGSVSINPPDIPQLATGGVLTAPTMAWVAEAGQDEAVIPLRELWREMDKVYKAGRTRLDDPESRSPRRGATVGGTGAARALRLVEGRLTIDKSGRAYIRGVAEDVYEGNDRFAGSHGRMG
jgi:TP901 family phage tail tape measure protein